MRYQWILFDADGTLFDFESAESAALEKAFELAGLTYESRYLELYRQINEQIWLELERGTIRREELKIRRFQQLFAAAGLSYDPSGFSDFYLEHLARGTDLLDDAERIVRDLLGRVGLVLVTNGLKNVQRPRIAASTLSDCFDHIVISEEVGYAKPDPRIFDVAFEHMDQPARDRVLIVGDSLTSDIRGGLDYGIDTCWFNPRGKPVDPETRARYEIRHLSEIESLIR
ncbi:MAG: YjjG family noncanonical pyrimidine nucleotidase [Acidobacteriota bacterium]